EVQPPDSRQDIEEAPLTLADMSWGPRLGRFDLARNRRHLALRMPEVDCLLAIEILIAGLVVLGPADEDEIAERLREQLTLVVVRKPVTPLTIAARALRQDMFHRPIRRIEILRCADDLVVEPQQNQLA